METPIEQIQKALDWCQSDLSYKAPETDRELAQILIERYQSVIGAALQSGQ